MPADPRSILSDRCDPELLDANPRSNPVAVDPYEIAPPESDTVSRAAVKAAIEQARANCTLKHDQARPLLAAIASLPAAEDGQLVFSNCVAIGTDDFWENLANETVDMFRNALSSPAPAEAAPDEVAGLSRDKIEAMVKRITGAGSAGDGT
jgi:hypothetical protein